MEVTFAQGTTSQLLPETLNHLHTLPRFPFRSIQLFEVEIAEPTTWHFEIELAAMQDETAATGGEMAAELTASQE